MGLRLFSSDPGNTYVNIRQGADGLGLRQCHDVSVDAAKQQLSSSKTVKSTTQKSECTKTHNFESQKYFF